MRILGIHDGHNASAALLEDGRLRFAIQEERLTRRKNQGGFPSHAIDFTLKQCGLEAKDIDWVALGSNFQDRHYHTPLDVHLSKVYSASLRNQLKRHLTQMALYKKYRTAMTKKGRISKLLRMGFGLDQLHFVDHHLAHAAVAYYGMRRDDGDYLVLTLDGSGDWLSSTVWKGRNGQMSLMAKTSDEHSVGYVYATVTRLLGFLPLEDEYKLMGMAAYSSNGAAEDAAAVFAKYLGLDPSHPMQFRKKTPVTMPAIGPHLERDIRGMRFDHICAGLQRFTEDLMISWVKACIEKTGIRRILAGGGVFMNVKANKRLMEMPEVEWLAVAPSCGDETLGMGACYVLANRLKERIHPLENFDIGNDIAEVDCQEALRSHPHLEVQRPSNLAESVARLLAQGCIVARAAGRMEFGARALGNRSILADPMNLDMVRVINRMVKRRDFWMPFAPVVLKRNSAALCVNPRGLPSPFMMLAFDTVAERREEFMAGVHQADLSARFQILEPGSNPPYEAILECFEKLTRRQALLNTSFNLHGQPIVCTAQDALEVFCNSGLDWLVLGPFLIHKRR